MADMAASFFGRPDRALKIVGVTGTNGKTTTAFILKHLLTEPKAPVGLIGTVRYEIGERVLPAARTTPESLDLHELLAQMKTAGCRAAVMEVSSHALEQGRVAPIDFQVGDLHQPDAGPSRLSRDDGELLRGEAAALREPRPRAQSPAWRCSMLDDAYGARLIELLPRARARHRLQRRGARGAEIEASDLEVDADGTRGTLRIGTRHSPTSTLPLIGSFNVANALAAAGGALALGIAPARHRRAPARHAAGPRPAGEIRSRRRRARRGRLRAHRRRGAQGADRPARHHPRAV